MPYRIQHPDFPNNSITIRHLATHTSSISDDKNYERSYIFSRPLQKELFQEAWAKSIDIYNKNQTMPMEDFLETIFSPKGKWNSSGGWLWNATKTSNRPYSKGSCRNRRKASHLLRAREYGQGWCFPSCH